MKKIFLLFFFLFLSFSAKSQNYKTFENEYLSFEYPSSFKQEKDDDPNILLSLEEINKVGYFLIVKYEANFGPNKSVWDEDIVNSLLESNEDEIRLSITKETIKTRGGMRRCLKVKSRSVNSAFNFSVISYIMIHEGNLYNCTYTSSDIIKVNSSTTYSDNLMKGLMFKTKRVKPTMQKNNKIDNFNDYIMNLNKQMPIQVDEATRHDAVILVGKTLTIKTTINDEYYNITDFNLFKRNMCKNFAATLEKPFVEYMKKKEYTISYIIFNESGLIKKKINITPSEILYYYNQ
ncbi:MAG: hypothetical protein ILA07_09440 [Prevotella sp.]|nr:hypothetical protein [Prevotella sp.]